MGNVVHWVNRFNWSLIPAIVIAGAFSLAVAGVIADAIRASSPVTNLTIQIDNKGHVQAFKSVGGNLVPIPVPK